MSGMEIVRYRWRKLAFLAAIFAGCALLLTPNTAKAQVAVLVNGAPITEMDITQRRSSLSSQPIRARAAKR